MDQADQLAQALSESIPVVPGLGQGNGHSVPEAQTVQTAASQPCAACMILRAAMILAGTALLIALVVIERKRLTKVAPA